MLSLTQPRSKPMASLHHHIAKFVVTTSTYTYMYVYGLIAAVFYENSPTKPRHLKFSVQRASTTNT